MAKELCLVLGGVRSGKSSFAEQLAQDRNQPTLYVATAISTDAEMAERIRRHRQSRPSCWTTLEESLDLAPKVGGALSQVDPPGVVLIDSIDLWVSNMLLQHENPREAAVESGTLAAVNDLLKIVCTSGAHFFLVSGEVGLGLVSPEPLGRRFQDLLGLVNQRLAAAADRVYLVVAGIPQVIKVPGGH